MEQETIEGAAIAYSEYRFITPDCISERAEERCLACKEGFITGVSWYKSRVWHQVSLLPEHRKKIIVKKHSGIVSIWDVDVNMASKFKSMELKCGRILMMLSPILSNYANKCDT